MTYIKLLTVLAGLALLTACGGGTGLTATNDTITPECMTNPFGDGCNRFAEALASQEIMCLADATADPSCLGETGIATVFCKDNPFHNSNACRADTGAIVSRQNMCLTNDAIHSTCGAVIMGVCEANPFQTDACLPDEDYLPNRIAACIKYSELDMADKGNCRLITTDTAKNTMLTDCLANPFATACEASESAFSTYAETAQTNLASFCNDSDSATDGLCKGDNVRPICGTNPFNAICFTGTTYLSDRVADCIKTENTEAEKCNTLLSNTAMNTTITNCLTNPFTDTCASNADFMTHATTAQMNREVFCDMAGNNTKALCMGENLMGVCDIDSFNVICLTDKTYLPMRLGECIKTENAEDMRCNTLLSDATMNTAITACLTNPFSDTCEADSDFMTYAETAQTNRVSFCGMMGNDTKALCMGENVMGVCGIDPFNAICINNTAYLTNRQMRCVTDAIPHTSCGTVLGSIVDPTDITGITDVINHADLPATVAATAAITNSKAHFVSVGANGIDTTGLGISNNDRTEPTPATLSRAGDAMDGVTYVSGVAESATQSFVGLLPTTNLGAPLPIGMGQPTDAEWTGRYFNRLIVGAATHHPITFDINFAEGTITTDPDTQGTVSTTFNLGFTAEGVITGTVGATNSASTLSDTAPVRGLIGEQGLVGGFADTDGGVLGPVFYGGFVAEPPDPCIAANNCVNHALWLANARNSDNTEDLTIRPAGVATEDDLLGSLITGDTNVLDALAGTGINVEPKYTVTLSQLSGSSDTNSGFGFAFARQDTTINSFYVGLLSGTNVGAPFTNANQPAAEWSGKISFDTFGNNFRNVPFTLDVGFDGTAGTIKTKPGGINFATNQDLTIDGRFGANGVIYGGVAYTRPGFQDVVSTASGSLSGLIGVNGAVAVFGNFSASGVSGYGGGFVVQPTPSP